MSEYFTKWWCNRVKQDDEFTRVRFWENLHPPFPKLNVKFWSMGLFTWALLTGPTHLPGLISPWKKWEISAQIPRWERGQRQVVAWNSRNKSKHGKTHSYNFHTFHSFGNSCSCTYHYSWIGYLWCGKCRRQTKTMQNSSEEFIPVTGLKCSYGKNFQPAYRDSGWKNRDLRNWASPLSHMNTSKLN